MSQRDDGVNGTQLLHTRHVHRVRATSAGGLAIFGHISTVDKLKKKKLINKLTEPRMYFTAVVLAIYIF